MYERLSAGLASCELSVIFPCLNEEKTIGKCIKSAQSKCNSLQLNYEIIVADNGSTDRSIEIANLLGAKIVKVPVRGYGAAIIAGISISKGEYIIQLDSDNTYRLDELELFLNELRGGATLVMGNRFANHGIKRGAMPWLHRYVGNPILSFVGRVLFNTKIRDFHCGLRAYRRDSFLRLGAFHTGMEFASEIILKFALSKADIRQIPISLYPDERDGGTHLNTFRDGWRHLKYLLAYSPKAYLLLPSLSLLLIGWGSQILFLTFDVIKVLNVNFSSQTLVATGFSSILGLQLFLVDRNRRYSIRLIYEADLKIQKREYGNETVFLLSLCIGIIGFAGLLISLNSWRSAEFGDLDTFESLKLLVPSICLILSAIQVSSYSVLELTSKVTLKTALKRFTSS